MPEVAIKLLVMLGAGILARYVVTRVVAGRPVNGSVRIPRLVCYAAAGIAAALVRLLLEHGTGLQPMVIWVVFGAVWGVVIALLLPYSRPRDTAPAS